MSVPFGALLGVLAAAALVAGSAGFLAAPDVRIARFVEWAVPVVLLNVAAAAIVGLLCLRRTLRAGVARRALTLDAWCAAALLVPVVLVGLALPAEMRIQTDELLVAGTALGIELQGTPVVVAAGFVAPDGAVEPLGAVADKRGVLGPLLFGYAQRAGADGPHAGFAFNLLCGWLALVALYALFRQWLDAAGALAAALATAAFPAFLWSTRSLLLEPLNLALLAAVLALVVRAWRTRRVDLAVLAALVGALAAQARYESVLAGAAALLAAVALVRAAPAGRVAWILCAVPLLYLPFAWQRAVDFSWGLAQLGETEPFAVAHLVRNAGHAVAFLAWPSPMNPLAPALAALALAGLAAGLRGAGRSRPWDAARAWPALVFVAAVVAPLGVILVFVWGDLRDPVTSRLGIPLCATVAFGAIVGWRALRGLVTRRAALDVLVGAALAAAGLHAVRTERTLDRLQVAPSLVAARDWARSLPPDCRPLVVSPYAPYFLAYGVSAVTPAMVEASWGPIVDAARARGIGGAWLVQVTTADGAALDGNTTSPDARLGVEHERIVDPLNGLRVLRYEGVGAVDAPRDPACETPPVP